MNFKSVFIFVLLFSATLAAQVNLHHNADFYPLHNGDVWFYKWTYDNKRDSAFAFEKVVGDTTLVNGHKYFIKRVYEFKDRVKTTPIRSYDKSQRVDETMGLVFQFDPKEPFPHERKIFNLFSGKGDTTIMDSHGFLLICINVEMRIVFNNARTIKSFSLPNTYSFCSITDGIGETVFITGIAELWNEKSLLSAKIAGKYYGDSLTISSLKTNIIIPNFILSQNYPNPFNPETKISYSIPKSEHVTLKIYDLLGREVATLVDEFQNPGSYHSTFSTIHSSLSSGIYFYRLQSGSFCETKKFVLMK